MRAFVAIPVPEAWIAPLMRAQGAVPGGRSVDADDLHITLAFLDEQPESALEALHDALDARALPAARLLPLAYAPFGDPARLVALDLARDAGLTALRDAVRAGARAAGIDLPRDRFRPHVTLRRASRRVPFDAARLPARLSDLGPPPHGARHRHDRHALRIDPHAGRAGLRRARQLSHPHGGRDVSDERIPCRTPAGSSATNIPAWKFDACREAILAELSDGPMRASAMANAAGRRLTDQARRDLGSLGWHVTTVRLELEVRGEIERLPGSPLRIQKTT